MFSMFVNFFGRPIFYSPLPVLFSPLPVLFLSSSSPLHLLFLPFPLLFISSSYPLPLRKRKGRGQEEGRMRTGVDRKRRRE